MIFRNLFVACLTVTLMGGCQAPPATKTTPRTGVSTGFAELKTAIETDEASALANLESHPELAREPGEGGVSALHVAILAKREAVARKAIELGADVNLVKANGNTPLLSAVHLCSPEFIDFLLEKGGNVKIAGQNDITALHNAAGIGRVEIVEVLLKHGAAPNACSGDQVTPLLNAVSGGHEAVALRLLKSGADPNVVASNGATALYTAIAAGHLGLVDPLIAHGADPRQGKPSALDLALASKKPALVEKLKQAQAKESK